MAAAHLIHGSARPVPGYLCRSIRRTFSQEEVEAVGFRCTDVRGGDAALLAGKRFRMAFRRWKTVREIYFVRMPALGLWREMVQFGFGEDIWKAI